MITGSSTGVVDLGECPNPPRCTLTQDDCLENFVFDLESCSCLCLNECSEPWVLNLETCSCDCPVECSEPFVLNPEDCACECGITACPAGWTLDLEACECLPCEPVGEPECPEQTWDVFTCSWVGDCPCEPVGEPECPKQTWDYDLCEWVGDCPPDCCDYVWTLEVPDSFYRLFPFGSPRAECAHYGMVPAVGPAELKIRKGGKCYEVTSECGPSARCAPKVCCDVPFFGWRCFDESHVTHCTCEEN